MRRGNAAYWSAGGMSRRGGAPWWGRCMGAAPCGRRRVDAVRVASVRLNRRTRSSQATTVIASPIGSTSPPSRAYSSSSCPICRNGSSRTVDHSPPPGASRPATALAGGASRRSSSTGAIDRSEPIVPSQATRRRLSPRLTRTGARRSWPARRSARAGPSASAGGSAPWGSTRPAAWHGSLSGCRRRGRASPDPRSAATGAATGPWQRTNRVRRRTDRAPDAIESVEGVRGGRAGWMMTG